MKNPFIIYIGIFFFVIVTYQLGWSSIYPGLSLDILMFFAFTFFLSFTLSLIFSRNIKNIKNYNPGRLPKWIFPLLLFLLIIDIAYTGVVPLWMVINRYEYSYLTFGIPTLHVAIITFSGAFATIRFADYLYSHKSRYLFEAIVPIVFDILIVNRGAVLITLVTFAFVLIIKRGKLGLKRTSIALVIALTVLYGFGLLGNIRSGAGGIEEIGQPTPEFSDSEVPKSYFWTYIYLTSPLANFEKTLSDSTKINGSAMEFVTSEMTPDFISKRIFSLANIDDRIPIIQISPSLNASGLFARSYAYLGWFGPIFMFSFFSLFIIGYLLAIRKSAYSVPALALLNTLIVFSIFDNMIAFTGMSLQLLWPLIINIRRKSARKLSNFNVEPCNTMT
ncbi:hypothetical protein [Glaciimonas soli]|uniref:Oligosaccharide repeat unit polymerase n=1 Tax=Glaciimonas soli TaxID=2590999 RepID=A0A843YUE3_9BURK|nr:hypothetical protein [Glaciimonas soli]MQR01324.1 hypothetical protein [Glaciimonas soli]